MYTLFKCKLERRKDMKVEKDYLDTLFEFYGIESAPNQKDGIWIKGENGELEPFDCLKNFQDIFFPQRPPFQLLFKFSKNSNHLVYIITLLKNFASQFGNYSLNFHYFFQKKKSRQQTT